MAKKRYEEPEEHENHERWLVSYADMVTLLMVLFIVMFAMSQVDEKKFNQVKVGLAAGFGTSVSVLDGAESVLEQPGDSAAASIKPVDTTSVSDPAKAQAVEQAITDYEKRAAGRRAAAAENEAERLNDVAARLQRTLREKGLQDDVQTQITDRGLVVSLVSRHVTFEPNVADLSGRGRAVVDALAPVLLDLPDPLVIEGNTNQVPVKPKYYPSDWELSAARAVNVLRYLTEQWKLPAERLTATAHGHENPLVDPDEPGSQRVNKRVDIVVETALPTDTQVLLSEAATETSRGSQS